MLKILAGQYRGQRLESPDSIDIRPTSSRVRESFFGSLVSRRGGSLEGLRFLDLFAGSGLMGFEALSRGADHVTAVECVPEHARLIERNAKKLKLTGEAFSLVLQDALIWTAKPWRAQPFDVVFMDPPYGYDSTGEMVRQLLENGWINPEEGELIVEQERRDPPLENFDRKTYGDTVLLNYYL